MSEPAAQTGTPRDIAVVRIINRRKAERLGALDEGHDLPEFRSSLLELFGEQPEWSVFEATEPRAMGRCLAAVVCNMNAVREAVTEVAVSEALRKNAKNRASLRFSTTDPPCASTPENCSFHPASAIHRDLPNPPEIDELAWRSLQAAVHGGVELIADFGQPGSPSVHGLLLDAAVYCDSNYPDWHNAEVDCPGWADYQSEHPEQCRPAAAQRNVMRLVRAACLRDATEASHP